MVILIDVNDYRFLSGELKAHNNSIQTTKTKLEVYGDSTYCNKQKILNTFNEKYGVNNAMQVAEFFERQNSAYKSTMNDRYGVEYGLQSSEIREKCKATWKLNGRHQQEKHPLARKIQITSPTGEVWVTHGNFKNFIKETLQPKYGISYSILRKILHKTVAKNSKKSIGWLVVFIDN